MRKRGQTWETLVPWIIGLAFLALMIGVYMVLRVKGISIIDNIKGIFSFGQ
jgi:uncharacterized membrane protein